MKLGGSSSHFATTNPMVQGGCWVGHAVVQGKRMGNSATSCVFGGLERGGNESVVVFFGGHRQALGRAVLGVMQASCTRLVNAWLTRE